MLDVEPAQERLPADVEALAAQTSPTTHQPLQTGHRTFGRRYGRASRSAAANSTLLRHHCSRFLRHRYVFVRQAAEQYRRDRQLPSGSGVPHWLPLGTVFLGALPGASRESSTIRKRMLPFVEPSRRRFHERQRWDFLAAIVGVVTCGLRSRSRLSAAEP
ncbi:hypothetical protein A6A06_37775 [Streptomyces sp. CB02923]|nr:hypothetical protein A6A06_37775 [Streptomyces sp. CB02923]